MQWPVRVLRRFQMSVHDAMGKASYGLASYHTQMQRDALDAALHAKRLAFTATTPLECVELYHAVHAVEVVPGEMAEFGVFQGGTAAIMLAASPSKHLHLFDTFAGLPSAEGKLDQGDYSSSLATVRRTLQNHDGRVSFHPGFFPESAAEVENHRFSFVHLDVDLYESTLAGLQFFWPRLVCGGALLSHDYPILEGVVRAFSEYFEGRKVATIPLSGNNVLVVKSSEDAV